MGSLHLNTNALAAPSTPTNFLPQTTLKHHSHLRFPCRKIRSVSTVPESVPEVKDLDEPPAIDFAFVHSVLLPDGTPDVHFRRACGGQKLRDIMLDNNIDLYGPYARALLNCAGGGTCGTCLVEVVEGQQLLNPRTEKEKEKLKKKPKNWRLACQATVGKPDSTGLVVIQQLPEWKAHEWTYAKVSSPPQWP